MPAEVESRTGLKPVRRGTAPSAECEGVATDLTEGLTRSVQTSTNNSLQSRSREEIFFTLGPRPLLPGAALNAIDLLVRLALLVR